MKQMGKRTIAIVAAALLGLGVVGAGAARVGGYLSNTVSPGATSQSSQTAVAGGSANQSGAGSSVSQASAGGLASQTGDGAGQGGD
jgi:hypothetical protein